MVDQPKFGGFLAGERYIFAGPQTHEEIEDDSLSAVLNEKVVAAEAIPSKNLVGFDSGEHRDPRYEEPLKVYTPPDNNSYHGAEYMTESPASQLQTQIGAPIQQKLTDLGVLSAPDNEAAQFDSGFAFSPEPAQSVPVTPQGQSFIQEAPNKPDTLATAKGYQGPGLSSPGHAKVSGEASPIFVEVVATEREQEAPEIEVQNVMGLEDGTIVLPIHVKLHAGNDPSAVHIELKGVPEGATLSHGSYDGDIWRLHIDDLKDLTLKPPKDFSGDLEIQASAITTNDLGAEIRTSSTFKVDVEAVADKPSLTVHNTDGAQLSSIPLNIAAHSNDIDGSESLLIELSDVANGVQLSTGSYLGRGVWKVAPDEIHNLSIETPFFGEHNISVKVTAIESSNSSSASVTKSFDINVSNHDWPIDTEAVAPGIDMHIEQGTEDGFYNVNIYAFGYDPHGSDNITVKISGVPKGSTFNHGSEVEPGTWLFSQSELSGLQMKAPHDFAGEFTMGIAVQTVNAYGNTAETTNDVTVNVAPQGDAPLLLVGNSVGEIGQPVPINIYTDSTDIDGSDSEFMLLDGVPNGVQLSSGFEIMIDGTSQKHWFFTGEDLAQVRAHGLTASGFTADGAHELRVITVSLDPVTRHGENMAEPYLDAFNQYVSDYRSGDISGAFEPPDIPENTFAIGGGSDNGTKHFTVTVSEEVHPRQNPPIDFEVTQSMVAEDLPVDLSINITGNVPPHSLVMVEIEGVPDDAYLTAGAREGDKWVLGADQLSNLQMILAKDDFGNYPLNVSIIDVNEYGLHSVNSKVLDVTVYDTVGTPGLEIQDVKGLERYGTALNINAYAGDLSESDNLTIKISNVPDGATLNNGIDSGDGTWLLTRSDLHDLQIAVAQNGSYQLQVDVVESDSLGNSKTTSGEIKLEVGIEGTNAADVIMGDERDNVIFGFGGDDVIDGNGGSDLLYGGRGDDTLTVDNEDIVDGGEGYDTVVAAGASMDRSFTDAESIEKAVGGTEDDRLDASHRSSGMTLEGGAGDDVLIGGAAEDKYDGGAGDDTFYIDHSDQSHNPENLQGGEGKDRVVGQGEEGIYVDMTESSIEEFEGTIGDDEIRVDSTRYSENKDDIKGGLGSDTLRATSTDGATGIAIDTMHSGFENVFGTSQSDNIDGSTAADDVNLELHGEAGDDILRGGYGADKIYGGEGDDQLYVDSQDTVVDGGDGTDTAIFSRRFSRAFVDSESIEKVTGSASDDIVDGRQLSNSIEIKGEAGDDVLYGGSGSDKLYGGEGDDTLHINQADVSGDGAISGGAGTDTVVTDNSGVVFDAAQYLDIEKVQGGSGDDHIIASTNTAEIDGGAGNDILESSSIAQTIRGGDGDDQIISHSKTRQGSSHYYGDNIDAGAGDDTITIMMHASHDNGARGEQRSYVRGGDGHDTLNMQGDHNPNSWDASNVWLDGELQYIPRRGSYNFYAEDLASLDLTNPDGSTNYTEGLIITYNGSGNGWTSTYFSDIEQLASF